MSHHNGTCTLCSFLTLVRTVVLRKVMAPSWPATKRQATHVTGCRRTEFSLKSQFSSSLITGMLPLLPSAHRSELAPTLALLACRRCKGQTSKFIINYSLFTWNKINILRNFTALYILCVHCRVTFKFKSSKRSNNGTDVASGQIPEILYRIPEVEKETGVPVQLLDKSFSSTVSAVCMSSSYI